MELQDKDGDEGDNLADPFEVAAEAAEALMACTTARAVLLTGSLVQKEKSNWDDIDLLFLTDEPRPKSESVLDELKQKFGSVHPERAP